MMWLWLVSVSWAGGNSLVRPSPPDFAPSECSQSIPIKKGEPIPAALLDNGVARCSAIAEPTSSLAYLLAMERYERAISDLHMVDVALLETERDWFKAKYEERPGPAPWLERPSTQRWIGRLETLATVAIVAGAASAAYIYGPRGPE